MLGTETTGFATDMFKNNVEAWNQAVSAGIKLQEQGTQMFNDTVGKSMDQFFTQAEKFGNEVIPTFKKNVQRVQRTIDDQAKKGLDVVRQSFESAEASFDGGFADKTMDLWRSSFDAMRTGFDTMTKANAQMFDTWVQMTEKCCEAAGTKSAPKAATK